MKKSIIAMGLVLLSVAGLSGCGRERQLVEMTERESGSIEQDQMTFTLPARKVLSSVAGDSGEDESEETTKLTALADDLEEAEKIADLYGIELDSYSYGVAVYVTDKDIQELISLGEENDYPTLAPNHKEKLHTVQ